MKGDCSFRDQGRSIPTELVERLSAATVGSRELDALIWLRLNRPDYSGDVKALEMRDWYDGRGHLILETEAGEEVADGLGIAPVTTSLDAALALADRVLPGLGAWDVGYAYNGEPPHYARLVIVRDGPPEEFGRAATPALALCCAILKALAAQASDTAGGEKTEGAHVE